MANPEKLAMRTPSLADANFVALAVLFPNAVTETVDENGAVVRAIDKDVLTQEINAHVVDGREERYQFTWPDKRNSILLANAPIAAALRPCREESMDFDTTENLYIEGDNLDVLKLLRETYLNRVKMIYIDPPYNTGNDFVYEDDFAESAANYAERSGDYDEQGNRLVKNLDSNGRFHTNWLNMIYPRLRIARDLLTDDGVILVSCDDNEQANTVKLLNDVFGENNKVAEFIVIRAEGGGLAKQVIKGHDYLFAYAKNIICFTPLGRPKDIRGKVIERNGEQYWIQEDWLRKEFGKYGNCHYEEVLEYKGEKTKAEIDAGLKSGKYILVPKSNGMNIVGKLRKVKEDASKFYSILRHLSAKGIKDLEELGLDSYFSYPKPVSFLKEIVLGATIFDKDSIILDFFSGSATTAHAVMKLNAEDGGNRKFIMVQLPEVCTEGTEAAKAGYSTICEIGKERIRRAGADIKADSPLTTQDLDTGFRVLKLDSTNMKDVYYTPDEYAQMNFSFDGLADNIEADRSPEDLLFQVMLNLGIPLSAKITQDGDVYYVNDNYLIACFKRVDKALITEITKQKPYYAVFRDSSFSSDSEMVNFEQVFNTYSPNTIRRVM